MQIVSDGRIWCHFLRANIQRDAAGVLRGVANAVECPAAKFLYEQRPLREEVATLGHEFPKDDEKLVAVIENVDALVDLTHGAPTLRDDRVAKPHVRLCVRNRCDPGEADAAGDQSDEYCVYHSFTPSPQHRCTPHRSEDASFLPLPLGECLLPPFRPGPAIANVAITDFDFSAEFNRAIEEKVRAEQEALKAINEKLRRVTQAEAAAAERTLAADAEAYQIEVASKARADAIRREAEALKDNPALIQLRIAEKWNGQLPQVSGGGAIPLLDLRSLTQE